MSLQIVSLEQVVKAIELQNQIIAKQSQMIQALIDSNMAVIEALMNQPDEDTETYEYDLSGKRIHN